jgi:hypothetical protein
VKPAESKVIPWLEPRPARERRIRRERAKPHRQRMREKIVATLAALEDFRERLIRRLDQLDGDPDLELDASDLEEGGDLEPSLGSSTRLDQRFWSLGGGSDRERDLSDREPNLAAPEGAQTYAKARAGGLSDREASYVSSFPRKGQPVGLDDDWDDDTLARD